MTAEIVEQHRQLLEQFWKGLTRGDRKVLAATLADDVVWHVPPYYVRLREDHDAHGRDELVKLFLDHSADFYQPRTVRLQRIFLIADEQFGALQFINSCKTVANADYDNIYVFAFRFAAGRIAEGWEHLDSAWFNHVIHGRD
ncbi:MAG: nuclear transport factor 2 family protein [Candidatus Binatia bacterium]